MDTKDAATYYPDAFGCICYSLLHNKLAQTWQLKTTPTFFFLKKEREKKKNLHLRVLRSEIQVGQARLSTQSLIRLKLRCWLLFLMWS